MDLFGKKGHFLFPPSVITFICDYHLHPCHPKLNQTTSKGIKIPKQQPYGVMSVLEYVEPFSVSAKSIEKKHPFSYQNGKTLSQANMLKIWQEKKETLMITASARDLALSSKKADV